jgi:hypothetical protein
MVAASRASPEDPPRSLAPRAAARPASRLLRKLLVLGGATLIALVVAELMVRRLSPAQLGFEFENGAFERPREFTRDTTLNSIGFHDREHGPPAPGVTRVILTGDSYVAAMTVPVEQTVAQRFEHHLNASSDHPWEVFAVGHEGWGQKKELAALEAKGGAIHPDVVVTLFLPFNDFRNNSPELDEVGKQEKRSLEVPASEVPVLFFQWSVLNQLISHRLAVFLARNDQRIPVDFFAYSTEPDPMWERAWGITETLLLDTRAAATNLGADYLIASASTPSGVLGAEEGLDFLMRTYPAMRGRSWDLDLPDRRLAQFCAEKGIPFMAMEPTFREETRAGKRLHWPYNGHWNVEGNDLAGRLLAKMILERERERRIR